MRLLLSIIFIALLAGLNPVSTATPGDATEESIQGTWRAEGTDPSGKHAWYQEWTFDHGKFKQMGYPPIVQEGSYRVLKAEGNKLTLEFYDQKGTFGTENSQLEIVVDKKKGALLFKNQTFKRVKAQPK